MGSSYFKLRVGDFKKMVRLIVGYVILNMAAFALTIFWIQSEKSTNLPFPLEFFLIGFFMIFTFGFVALQKRNATADDVTIDSRTIHTNRFGTILISDILHYSVFRKKRTEDIILTLTNGSKISFGPEKFRNSASNKIYEEFKTIVASQIPKKNLP